MKEKIEKWINLGHNRDDINNNEHKISSYNLNILISVLAFTIIICIVVTFFYIFVDRKINSAYSTILMGFFLTLLLCIANYFKKLNVCNNKVNGLISICLLTMYLYSIYIGTFKAEGDLAVTAIVVFIFLQVIFVWNPLKNLIVIAVVAIGFIVCSYYTKDSRIASYDTIHCILAVCIGNFMSWIVAKVKVDYLVAENKLLEQNELLYRTSIKDELTKLFNRKKIVSILNDIGEECIRENEKLVCIIMDIDNFKSYNDTYGHPAGDVLLENVGYLLKDIAKKNNINIGRLGGEEFIAVWKYTESINSDKIAKEIKVRISELYKTNNKCGIYRKVTISQGMVIHKPKNTIDINKAYHRADKALYIAKKNGKDTIVVD